jgi:NADPH-dependent curcumin reductase CurA
MSNAWVIAQKSVGLYSRDVLRFEDRAVPAPAAGEVLLRPILLSLDPSNLMWLKLEPGWMEDVRIGDVMKGPAIAAVEQSNDAGLAPGDLVFGALNWQSRSVVPGAELVRLPPRPGMPLEDRLTLFSHVGRAALIGIAEIGRVRAGETVLVSAAAGATGSIAAQIAKARGCRVVGIAGGADKTAYLKDGLRLDGAIDYKAEDLGTALTRACPDGVDVYFDNVGGPTLDAALLHLRVGARIVVCGAISQYAVASPGEAYRYVNLFQLLTKRARIEGFVVPDFASRYEALDAELAQLYAAGRLTVRAHVVEGLEQAAAALELLQQGGNHGKLMVRVMPAEGRSQE